MKVIPYSRQCIEPDDIQNVIRTLRSSWLTQGPKIREFEENIAAYCQARYAVALSSGTAALHVACLAAGIHAGDEVITSPITFLATSNAVIYAGGMPVFADIDYVTGNIAPQQIGPHLSRKTKAIIPVHLAGMPAEMKQIKKIAGKNRLVVIEDACHALGGRYRNHKIGSCRYSDMTVFSFHPVKQMTTGEGGCITTNSRLLYEKIRRYANHGMVRNQKLSREHGDWYYEMQCLGYNYRITDFQCALGISQLRKLDRFQVRRQEIARRYKKAFSSYQDRIMLPPDDENGNCHAWHLFVMRLTPGRSLQRRRTFFEALNKCGIRAQVHYIPVYRQPYYRRFLGSRSKLYPNAERYYREAVSLPLFPSMRHSEIQYVIQVVRKLLNGEC